jgi:hypothetical protein
MQDADDASSSLADVPRATSLVSTGDLPEDRLRIDGGAITRRVALCLPQDLPIAVWQRIGRQLFLVTDSSAWWLGDWLVYGEQMYPDRYRAAITATSLDYQTLRNYAWVARKFPPSRRRDKLSFQHHTEVAALPWPVQEIWLGRAERNHWSRNELRRRLRAARGTQGATTTRIMMILRVGAERQERWRRAAGEHDLDLEEWAVLVLDKACDVSLPPTGAVAWDRRLD